MCGLVGTVGIGPLDDDVRDANRALTALLARRGPDDEGHWTDERIALGFRRLAVLDLSPAGHQPMESLDGRWVLVFNGEVYNFRKLRAELEADGVRFRSDADTEVVLHALVRWGSEALARFNGMFALALYDRERHTVLLARDPMGVKPLYWLEHPKGIVFSSQYDAVVRHPWCERQRLRADVAAMYLRFGYVPAPYGIVEQTGQLRPGSMMTWSSATGPVVEQFTAWPDPPEHYLGADGPEAVHAALHDAVRRQLVADVPVWRHRLPARHSGQPVRVWAGHPRIHHWLGVS